MSELDSASLSELADGDPPMLRGSLPPASSDNRSVVRGRPGCVEAAGIQRTSGNLGDPAAGAGQQVAPAPKRWGRHNLPSGAGRESDLPIVARKRLIPVEPRGRTLIGYSAKEGSPLERKFHYG